MSVIIRLQNLPWSANAGDIRKYFHGLSIPEGGVHIVGGEQGDAFIAFSTDEDARQAMLIDGGKINEVKIKLLLSSRSEMQKVIEIARQQAMNLQNYLQMPAQPIVPTMPMMPQVPQQVMPPTVAMQPMPTAIPNQINDVNRLNAMNAAKVVAGTPVPALSGMNSVNAAQIAPAAPLQDNTVITDVDKKSDSDDDYSSRRGSRRSRDSSHSRSRSRSRDRRDRRDHRYRDRRDRDRDSSRHRDRNRDRDRDRDHDRRRRSDSRDKHRRRRDRSKSRDGSRRSTSSRDRDRDNDRRSKEMNGENKTSDSEAPKVNNMLPVGKPNHESLPLIKPNAPGAIGAFPRPGLIQPNAPNVPNNNSFPPMPEPPRMPLWNFPGETSPSSTPLKTDKWPANEEKKGAWNPTNPNVGTLQPPPMFMQPDFVVNNSNFKVNSNNSLSQGAFTGNAKPVVNINLPLIIPNEEEEEEEEGEFMETNIQETSTPKNCCIQIQNLSVRASYNDIQRFLQGLQIAPKGIKMINNDDGNRSGIAYVRFTKDTFKNQALKLNGRNLRETVVKIIHLDDYVYNEAIDDFKPPRLKDNMNKSKFDTIKLLQLPRYVKEKDIVHLFTTVEPCKVMIFPNKKFCDAFVEFNSYQEAEIAISQPLLLGHHKISVEPIFEKQQYPDTNTRGNMFMGDKTRNEPLDNVSIRQDPRRKQSNDKNDIPNKGGNSYPRQPLLPDPVLEPPVVPTDCLLLKGLPFKATDRDILDFFSDVGIVPSQIHIMFDKQGNPAGDAFCEFNTPDEASRGLVKQNAPMDRNVVTVVPIPRHEMLRAMGVIVPPPMMPHPMPGPQMMMPPVGMRMPMMQRPMRPEMFPGPPKFPPGPQADPSFPNDSVVVEGFGKPGCVVSLENVPFSAGVDDIIRFFSGFDVLRQNIIRRFDDNGKPTGDARVCLKSVHDAIKAVKSLNKRMIKNRIIYLSLVE